MAHQHVLTTIDLHDEAVFATHKIDGVRPNRLLANELAPAQRARSKPIPEFVFCVGRLPPQRS